ncbi:hypothetical protein JYK14_26240 [Siccirubricoccus sp. KC 17139]|uniref:Uncharacterized protein n=1 Tax=Siccirubricoccus soli TaxID=2899147 RepID=A0ABT1DFB0_9PROT|nr:hypothetical protein [Siccirubricoccus soli]MCO6419640.1 hypothetical protein [Siccirubricoccus soli]MCP2685775.1 hypothetical protein [Siccirubricoccus soli]
MPASLPDWGRPVMVDGRTAFATVGDLAPPVLLPGAIALATEPDGRPAFRLSVLRALPPAEGVGCLELRLRLEGEDIPGTVPARVARGSLRLRPAAALGTIPAELLVPLPLDWNGLGLARLALPLSQAAATLVEGLLAAGEGLGLDALAELEVDGIAPRLPGLALRLEVGALLAGLGSLAGPDGLLPREALLARLRAAPAQPGIGLGAVPEGLPPDLLALAVLDRLRARELLRPAPSTAPDGTPMLRLPAPGEALPERIDIDLAERLVTPRPVALRLDPVAAARALAAGHGGADSLVAKGSAAPLGLGFHRLMLGQTVPQPVAGILGLGARIRFPPQPPARPQEIRHDLELSPGAAAPELTIRLAPNEPLAWRLQGFAFVPAADGRRVERLQAEEVEGTGARALLTPALLPLRLVELEAEPALLGLGTLLLRLSAQRPGGPFRAEVELDRQRPTAVFGLPPDATVATIAAELRGAGGARLSLPPFPAEDRRLLLQDVPGLGPRDLRVEVLLAAGATLAALDLLPEDAAEGAEPVTLAFTPAEPARVFRWFCRDPFRPGLRWRRHAPGAAWSAPDRGPGPLVIALGDAA